MSRLLTISLATFGIVALMPVTASAQYYNPVPAPHSHVHQPGGVGLDLGLRNGGFNPNVGFGVGPFGAGVGSGIGRHGLGSGLNVGVGPLGVSADSGFGRNGLGARASSGVGNTGASLEGGFSNGGIGLGASSKLLGFGTGASIGIGKRGPGLGASVAFGPIGTLLIGSHRNSYPGAQQTMSHMYPSQQAPYYTAQGYGNSPYYAVPQAQYLRQQPTYVQPVYVQVAPRCPAQWTC